MARYESGAQSALPRFEGNFFQIPSPVLDGSLSLLAFRVYCHLKRLHDEGLPADSVKTSAQVCGVSANSIRRGLQELKEHGFIEPVPGLTGEEAAKSLQNKTPQSSVRGLTAICAWCASATAWLHSHHFPVPRCAGGQDVVHICPNCHAEFHYLIRDRYVITTAGEGLSQ